MQGNGGIPPGRFRWDPYNSRSCVSSKPNKISRWEQTLFTGQTQADAAPHPTSNQSLPPDYFHHQQQQAHFNEFIRIAGKNNSRLYNDFCQFSSHSLLESYNIADQITHHQRFFDFICKQNLPKNNDSIERYFAAHSQNARPMGRTERDGLSGVNRREGGYRQDFPRCNRQNDQNVPSNDKIINLFRENKVLPDNVLRVTIDCIKRCISGKLPTSIIVALVSNMNQAGIASNVQIFSAMITAHGNAGESTAARAIYDAMPEDMRNVISHSAMITAHGNAGRIDDAVKVYEGMPHRDVVTNKIVYALMRRFMPTNSVLPDIPEGFEAELTRSGYLEENSSVRLCIRTRAVIGLSGLQHGINNSVLDFVVERR